ncbi:hypothetical protein CIL05_06965 [Virgibacillus profundi]|uniref:Uncharacterized protein n=1 Tax=Virgibacillus profundi TaxID=2024555 RepID=A0A2A2IGE1_9BACI|nr:hypothetical protein CIL05_06965 [Virgibacillus profundi]PXY54372.1 hypothetical protein CIT14_07050 [Virgibacillus profundi]
MNFYSMDIKEIENTLNINHITKSIHDKEQATSTILDDWEQVQSLLNQFKQSHNIISVYGYELVHDNHFIKLYYKETYSNS